MRKILAALVLCAASLVPGFSLAAPSLAAQVPRTCNFNYHENIGLGTSRIWLTNISGCASGYPIFYDRTACIYKNVSGTFWYNGPTRRGAGSSTSNYSAVTCNQFPFPSVVQVWLWYNVGIGWAGKRLY